MKYRIQARSINLSHIELTALSAMVAAQSVTDHDLVEIVPYRIGKLQSSDLSCCSASSTLCALSGFVR